MKNIGIMLMFFFAINASAQEPQIESEHHGAEEGHRKHSLGLFAGITKEHDENHETLGIEYAYRFHSNWSVGGVVERAERESDSTLIIAFVHFWPFKGFFIGGGAGRKDPRDEQQVTYRASIGYEFELGNGWIIEPQANIDFIENEENEEVFGIAFGKQF